MKKINETDTLKETILLLENVQSQELILLKEQFQSTLESLKPMNLIKSTLHIDTSPVDIKDNLVSNVIGLTTGYLSKIVLMGATRNPITRLLGSILQFTVGNVVAKHSDTIKSLGELVIKRIFKKKVAI